MAPARPSKIQMQAPTTITHTMTVTVLFTVCLPNDFFQLALHLAEPASDALEDAGLGLFIVLLVLLSLRRLAGRGRQLLVRRGLFDLLVLRHSVTPFFLVTLPQAHHLVSV